MLDKSMPTVAEIRGLNTKITSRAIEHTDVSLAFFMLVCLLLLLPVKSAYSADPLGSIKVIVKDFYSDVPIGNAQVFVTPGNYSAPSDADGIVLFEDITPYRNYQVDVEADGYIKTSEGFITVNAGTEAESKIPMKQKATITGKVTAPFLFDWLRLPVRNAFVILGKIEEGFRGDYFVTKQFAKTGFNGEYTFNKVDEDSYLLIALPAGYKRSEIIELDVDAGQSVQQDLDVIRVSGPSKTPPRIEINDLSGESLELPTINGKRVVLDAKQNTDAVDFYWLKEVEPEGALPMGNEYYQGDPPGQNYTFIIPAMGDYVVRSLTVDAEKEVGTITAEFTAGNVPPTAVPSVIPGPSELPYLYNDNLIFTLSTGANAVQEGETVYLRGFAVDENLLSPEEFNPDAPGFDVYGTKNGNFSASIFSYSWSLMGGEGNDLSSLLLPSEDAENVSFRIPQGARPGDTFTAGLTVTDEYGLSSDPEELLITVSEKTESEICAGCHADNAAGYEETAHAGINGGADCQDCHGPGNEHVSSGGLQKLSVSYWPGVCGQCHIEFAELQKNNHSDPLPFGYYEPSEGRLTTCYKCHFTPGYVGALDSDVPFHKFSYGSDTLNEIPYDTPNVSCSVCHDPHAAKHDYSLRAESQGSACNTCHYEKWQNAIFEGISGEIGNGYHYPGEDYTPFMEEGNPHQSEKKCVLCHMSTSTDSFDENGVRRLGGHTFRMRYFGADDVPETSDDVLNLTVCLHCHEGLQDFDRNGYQTGIKALLGELGSLLQGSNHGYLPPNQPGKCARCHKGGTLPFLDDPGDVLENAYTNYKLILNDRSWGVHNPGYILKLLQDSIDSIK